jgi:multidrug efflux pump subunit AcrA (membrane-fusion protein)
VKIEDAMDVHSPKDGFVVELKVKMGMKVAANDPLLTMDTDDEDRNIERVHKMERVRALMAAQYESPELEVTRRIAQIAVEVADNSIEGKKALFDSQSQNVLHGVGTAEFQVAEADYKNALLAKEKATNDLKKFEFAIARHNAINEVVKNFMEYEDQILQTKRKRFHVLAPTSGVVSALLVGVNSFAARGQSLLVIK